MKKLFAIQTPRIVAALISLFAASSVQAKSLTNVEAKPQPISLTPRVILWGGGNVGNDKQETGGEEARVILWGGGNVDPTPRVILWGGGNVGNDKAETEEAHRFLGALTSPVGTNGLAYAMKVILWGGGNVGNGKTEPDPSGNDGSGDPTETRVILWGGGNVGN